jgi:Zn-dependent M28 family amino/carboxypeptidase
VAHRQPETRPHFQGYVFNENVRAVCRELDINFLTGRNLVQKYKKTGEYEAQSKTEVPAMELHNIKGTMTKDSNKKGSDCSLGILLLSDSDMQIVTSKLYKTDEENSLLAMHNYFCSHHII